MLLFAVGNIDRRLGVVRVTRRGMLYVVIVVVGGAVVTGAIGTKGMVETDMGRMLLFWRLLVDRRR